jgi:hypothetical protein
MRAVGEHAGDRLLVAVKDVDAEIGQVRHRGVDRGGAVDAGEQARRLHRQRRHGGGGDAERAAVHVDADHVHRRGDAAHGAAELRDQAVIVAGHAWARSW